MYIYIYGYVYIYISLYIHIYLCINQQFVDLFGCSGCFMIQLVDSGMDSLWICLGHKEKKTPVFSWPRCVPTRWPKPAVGTLNIEEGFKRKNNTLVN